MSVPRTRARLRKERISVALDRAAETSLITLYARAVESVQPDSLLRDSFARRLVRRLDYDFRHLAVDADTVIGIAVRARLLDDWVRDFIDRNPEGVVVHLGSGLDSRFQRVRPPRSIDWYDVDQPPVIELRRRLFRRRRGCHLVAAMLGGQDWLRGLPPDRPTLIVAEGLLLYLAEDQVRTLLRQLTAHFRQGELIFDGYDPLMLAVMQASPMIQSTGAALRWATGDGHDVERLAPRLHLAQRVTRFESRQVARLSPLGQMANWLRDIVPILPGSCAVLRFEFG